MNDESDDRGARRRHEEIEAEPPINGDDDVTGKKTHHRERLARPP